MIVYYRAYVDLEIGLLETDEISFWRLQVLSL